MTLGERIKFVRKNNNLNQAAFAKKLGISQAHVSKIENGSENPSETLMLFICYMFAINIEWLKNGTGEPQQLDKSFNMQFDRIRQRLEVLMKSMNDQTSADFLDSFMYFTYLFEAFFNPKKGFKDTDIRSLGRVLRNLWLVVLHSKENNRDQSEHQILMLKESVSEYVTAIFKE